MKSDNYFFKLLQDLFKQDQEDRVLFKNKKINSSTLSKRSDDLFQKFKEIVDLYGFPMENEVGSELFEKSIILTLHSSSVDFMRSYLEELKKVNLENYIQGIVVYLIDKIQVLSEQPQIYGTQYKIIENRLEFFEIKDPEHLDQRRKTANIEPHSEYIQKITRNNTNLKI